MPHDTGWRVEVRVERDGLPTDEVTELLVEYGGLVRGRFLLTAATQVSWPNLEQRLASEAWRLRTW